MAFQTPIAIRIQDENIDARRGKGIAGGKVDGSKHTQKGLKERKALADVSKSVKPSQPNVIKQSITKQKSVESDTRNKKSEPSKFGLTEQQIKQCEEWAKEGVEHAYFTGSDQQKLKEKNAKDAVKKEVDEIMTALRSWTHMAYCNIRPTMALDNDFLELKHEPEVLPPGIISSGPYSGIEAYDPFDEDEDEDILSRFPDICDLKLKNEYLSGKIQMYFHFLGFGNLFSVQ
ncbi:hypothetical protein AMTRI_Chr01g104290 [Amborella trichopoda]